MPFEGAWCNLQEVSSFLQHNPSLRWMWVNGVQDKVTLLSNWSEIFFNATRVLFSVDAAMETCNFDFLWQP